MQYYYATSNHGFGAGMFWLPILEWITDNWKRGEATVLFTDDYYQLWSPVVQQDEFPY